MIDEGFDYKNYNPDVISTLANLSSDEVFTPPEVVNSMLDMLPKELWSDKKAKFLDPATKSGIFLREIAKRLIDGLENEIPDLQERLDHIFHNQLYGIAITELTSLLSRRSIYGSKFPNSVFSFSTFDSLDGNIRFERTEHTWSFNKCIYCGAPKSEYGRNEIFESHAYEFIHKTNVKEMFNVKFDVIIGNPPYQLSDGSGGQGSSAIPIYHKFIEQAIKMNPRYISMIVPSRWFTGGKGLDAFREKMLLNNQISRIVDFPDSADCFPGVSIKGGVNYFLWERDHEGDCLITTNINGQTNSLTRPLLEKGLQTFIRYNQGVQIVRKIQKENPKSFANIVSPRMPFGIPSNFKKITNKKVNYSDLIIYGNNVKGYVDVKHVKRNHDYINKYKVFISFAYGAGDNFPHQIINKPFIGEPGSCSTETYLVIGPFENQKQANNCMSYIQTKLFRFMVLQKKISQNATSGVYELVPMLDFNEFWNDEKLYEKYNVNKEEQDFIDSMIRPMELE